MPILEAICFIACHGGPADHFATFAESLQQRVEVYATGPALAKFQERGIEVRYSFSIDPEKEDALAAQIAKMCAHYSVVITDLGHPFDIKLHKALAACTPHVRHLAYYDNPEPYVPGGYSTVAAEVMSLADGTLFANAHLAETGIGYYPIQHAEKIAKRRLHERSFVRQTFFQKHNLEDTGQKVLVYFGGNNETYFSQALPAFLNLLEQSHPDNTLIVLQQHPGAKQKNLDREAVAHTSIIVSELNTEEAQVLADAALYYQTSMSPQFVLAGIPTIQIGHEPYEDILVKNHLCPSVTTLEQWKACNLTPQDIPRAIILDGLGIRENWLENLQKAFVVALTECP
jgi:hypothetical protein